jgi:hypothetical protein
MSTLSPKRAAQIVISKADNMITSTGKYELEVSQDVSSYQNERGQRIVNLKAVTSEMKYKAFDLLRAGELQKAANVGLSFNVWPGGFIPSKGEVVNVQVTEYTNKQGVKSLVVKSLSAMAARETVRTSASELEEFANMLEDDSIVEETVEAVADVTVD